MKPESFVDGSIVNISNIWLKQANSKNYHHFFTKKFLRDKKIDLKHANNVFNITIVDDFFEQALNRIETTLTIYEEIRRNK